MERGEPQVAAPGGLAQQSNGGPAARLFTVLRSSTTQRGLVAILVLIGLSIPIFIAGYPIRLLTGIYMYAALATSLNIIAGYTGYADFGNVVFFGIGAYVTGILSVQYGWPLPLAIVVGAMLCAFYAMLLGLPILRLKGHYFAIATIGVMEATREIVINMDSLTGGGMGLTLPLIDAEPWVFYAIVYYAMFGLMLLYVFISWRIRRSRFGYGLRAIRADEQAAEVAGIDTTRYKVLAWMTSAAMTGTIGGVFAFWFTYIQPSEVFNIMISIKYWIMMLLGGAGTLLGPVVGAFFLELVSETVWSRFLELHLSVLGAIIVLVVIFMPRGAIPLLQSGIRPRAWLESIREGKV